MLGVMACCNARKKKSVSSMMLIDKQAKQKKKEVNNRTVLNLDPIPASSNLDQLLEPRYQDCYYGSWTIARSIQIDPCQPFGID